MPELCVGPDFALDTARFGDEGLRVGIFASPGAGKGYLLGVLLEELIGAGYPCVMIDPESELWTFRELGALVVGGPHGHVPFDLGAGDAIDAALRFTLDSGTPVVFDLGDQETDPEIRAGFEAVAGRYWRVVNAERHPSVLAVTEAHVIAPQTLSRGETASTRLPAILNRGRKRGVISLLETQRIADVANAVISHCNVRFVGRIDFEDDYRRVARSMPKGVTFADVASLERGSFYVPRLADTPVHVRERRVTHGGGTPEGGEVTLRDEPSERALEAMVERLVAIATAEQPQQGDAAARKERASLGGTQGERRGHRDASLEQPNDGSAARIAELERELAEARIRAAETQTNLAGQRDLAERERDRLRARVRELEEGARAASTLRNALAPFVGAGEGHAATGLSEERVVELIRQHTPAPGQGAALQPVDALRKRYLERSAQRLVDRVRTLDADAREVLLFLLAHPNQQTTTSIAKALTGQSGGAGYQRISGALEDLRAAGAIEQYKSGNNRPWRPAVEKAVRSELAPHNPTDDEVRSVIDRALSVIQQEAAHAS